MFDPTDKKKKNLVEKYKAFYMKAMKECKQTSFSIDEAKAIGKRVLNEILETAFKNQNISNDDRTEFIKQLEELLRQQCPDMLFDTPFEFTDKGFLDKKH
jgi:hypothetical protein